MISKAADYRYCNVSNINVRGNTMPQRGRRVSPRVLSAEDVASLAEGFYERLRLLDSKGSVTYYGGGVNLGGSNIGSVNCHGNPVVPCHTLHDPVCLASSIARLCLVSNIQSPSDMIQRFRAFVYPDRTPVVSVRKYPSRDHSNNLGAVCSSRYGWGHPILNEIGLNQCLVPFGSLNPPDWPRISTNRYVRGHTRLDIGVIRNAYDDLKQLRRLFLPMTTRYRKNDRPLLCSAVLSDAFVNYASANDPCDGETCDCYVSPVPALQPLVLDAGDPAPAYVSFESGCASSDLNPRGDTCDALYVSFMSARQYVSASGGGDGYYTNISPDDRLTLRAVHSVPLRSVGTVDSYSPANGEVVRVYALVRAWYRDWKMRRDQDLVNLVSPQEFLVSAGTTNSALPLSLIDERACQAYLKKAGMPTSIDEHPVMYSEGVNDWASSRACGVSLLGVWALVEPKPPNLKIDVHNCAW